MTEGTRRTSRFAVAILGTAVLAAGFAIVFRATLALVLRGIAHAANVVEAITAAPFWLRLLLPTAGAFAAGLWTVLLRKRESVGGVGDVMEAVALGTRKLSMVTTLLKSAASWCAIATGGSLGREGPLIQFGGTAGQTMGEWLAVDARDARVLVAAGTAAGFAAAYNTPLAAVAFVLEIVAGAIVVETVVPTLLATVIATALTRAVVGSGPIYGTRTFVLANPGELAAFACVGLVAALIAVSFTRLVSFGERAFHRPWLKAPWRQALGGLCAGAVLVWLPSVAGNGYEPLNVILDGKMLVPAVAALLLAKAFSTMFSVSSGSPGGVFTPTMLIGGCTGYLVGIALARLGLDVGPAGGYALVGMAAAIAATTHAPLMAAVLAFELSGDYAVVLPLALATVLATALAKRLLPESIYQEELRKRGVAWDITVARRADVRGDE
ncbi:MAG TPA: chloride channel protein [Kofleriaceae bacterium]